MDKRQWATHDHHRHHQLALHQCCLLMRSGMLLQLCCVLLLLWWPITAPPLAAAFSAVAAPRALHIREAAAAPSDGGGAASSCRPPISAAFPNDSYVDRNQFPSNFTFGALTWAVKHEGAASTDGKSTSIWDAFALQRDDDGSNSSSTVADNTTPNDGGDQYHHYQEDINLIVDIGFDSYKFSIAWTRIIPDGRAGSAVNQAGIDHYNEIINTLLDAGIEPMVTLYEQDMPQSLEESYGGLLSRSFIDDFVYYAGVCFAAFGDRVRQWVTFEEGNDFVAWGYAGRWAPPGRCSTGRVAFMPTVSFNCSAGNASTEPYVAAHHLLLAHASAADLYRTKYRGSEDGRSIGMVLWFKWLEPLSDSAADMEAAERATRFTVGWFAEPLLRGEYPEVMREIVGPRLPEFTEAESLRIRGSVDFIGLNAVSAFYCYDSGSCGGGDAEGYFRDISAATTVYRDGEAIGAFSGEYSVPWCMEKILAYWRHTYHNFPIYITALGFGFDTDTNDVDRINFYSSYMKSLLVGIRNGSNVLGLYVWSLIDGFETIFGLSYRFGIVFVDETFDRHPRLSALWFKNMLGASMPYSNNNNSNINNFTTASAYT